MRREKAVSLLKTTITGGGSSATAAGVSTMMRNIKTIAVAVHATNSTGEMTTISLVQAWDRRVPKHLVSTVAIKTRRLQLPLRG